MNAGRQTAATKGKRRKAMGPENRRPQRNGSKKTRGGRRRRWRRLNRSFEGRWSETFPKGRGVSILRGGESGALHHPPVPWIVSALPSMVAHTPPFEDLVENMPRVFGTEPENPLPSSAPAIEMSNTFARMHAMPLTLEDPFPPL